MFYFWNVFVTQRLFFLYAPRKTQKGETRELIIPPSLAYGWKGNDLFKIPPNTTLKWIVELVSIDSTIREDNNDVSRDEREGRALYSY